MLERDGITQRGIGFAFIEATNDLTILRMEACPIEDAVGHYQSFRKADNGIIIKFHSDYRNTPNSRGIWEASLRRKAMLKRRHDFRRLRAEAC